MLSIEYRFLRIGTFGLAELALMYHIFFIQSTYYCKDQICTTLFSVLVMTFSFFTETLKFHLITTELCKLQFLMPDTVLGSRTVILF